MNFQNSSPTPNELGISSSINVIDLKRKFEADLCDNFEEIRKDFDKLKNNLRSQTDKNFNDLKDELTSQNANNFSNLEEELKKQNESSIGLLRTKFLEFKEQNQKNNDQIQDNFSTLFKKLKIENINDDRPTSKVRQSNRIKEQRQQTRKDRKRRSGHRKTTFTMSKLYNSTFT
uniref:Uncharacterized protein n=2 Tax=Rhizophagus irregularis TaxID=588596 RepID=U9UIU3_RHIID